MREFLSVIGPGLVTSFADNDAGGVATCSVLGASFGYQFLWLLPFLSLILMIFQEMTVRMAVATGKGLSDLIRESFDLRVMFLAMGALLTANLAATISNFSGIAASFEIFNVPRFIVLPAALLGIWLLISRGSYRLVERFLLFLSMLLVSYIAAGWLSSPRWDQAISNLWLPRIPQDPRALMLVIAMTGTTVTPWMQFYLHASILDKGASIKFIRPMRSEVMAGAILTNVVSFFIVLTCASTLYPAGISVHTAKDAAIALQPLAGRFSEILFAVGLFSASLLGAFVIPLSTAYALCEAFGFEHGVNKRLDEAPFFYGIYVFVLAAAVFLVMVPKISLIPLMVVAELIQGILLPIILFFMLRLANDRKLMGKLANRWFSNVFGGGAALLLFFVSIVYVFWSARSLGT